MILDEIVAHKRSELEHTRARVPPSVLKALGASRQKPTSLGDALDEPGVGLIAEVKRASPSKGIFAVDLGPEELAETYVSNGASAVSVLTDERFFHGQLAFIQSIRSRLSGLGSEMLGTPILRKDFLLEPYQVYESYAYGADALLLIVAILSDTMLQELLQLSSELGMDALVEVHNEAEIERALGHGARIVGINNRDLTDFSVDLETFRRLARYLPGNAIAVAESGIHSAADVVRLGAMGADAILVGEALVTAPDVGAKVRELVAGASKNGGG